MRSNFTVASLGKVGDCGGFHGDAAKADALAVECH